LALDNEHGAHYDGMQLKVPGAWIGPLFLSNMSFKYVLSQDLWQGGAKVTLPGSTFAIDAAGPPTQPPDFGFAIKHGQFDHAGVAADFFPPAQPEVFPGVVLTHIGVAIGVNPLRFTGTMGVSAGDIVDVDGAAFVAFASPSQTYQFPADAGDELAPLVGRTLDSFTVAIAGAESVHIPFIGGKFDLAHAYLLYEAPDYFEFAGSIGFHRSFLSVDGGVSGFLYPSQHLFNLEGGVKACLRDINGDPIKIGYKFVSVTISPCLNLGGVISSTGIGVCGVLPVPFPIVGTIPVPIGMGYKWGDSFPDRMIFSCSYDDYRATSPRSAAAAQTGSVVIPPGLPAAMIRVHGRGGTPDLVVRGPHGESLDRSGDIVTMTLASSDTTLIGLRRPAGGRWTLTTKSGSPPIASIAIAHALRRPSIKARVTGTGSRWLLTYRVSRASGTQVTFAERGPRTFHVLGRARTRAGKIFFTPAPDRRGRRTIVALISQNGRPQPAIVVAAYSAPSPTRPAAPTRVRVRRRQRMLSVSWKPVSGASRYEVTVLLADGTHEFAVVRRPHARLGLPGALRRGRVLVDALNASNLRGRVTRAPIR
jgi:hypothetical protein